MAEGLQVAPVVVASWSLPVDVVDVGGWWTLPWWECGAPGGFAEGVVVQVDGADALPFVVVAAFVSGWAVAVALSG